MGFVLPTLLASCWNDGLAGFLYGGYFVRLLIWHSTFSINSFAHLIGTQEYTTEITARGNLFLALLTGGEGHHNFHHEFPMDYRNGIKWYDYDPTKWAIVIAAWLRQAYALKKTTDEDIRKAILSVAQQKIDSEKVLYDWGVEDSALPSISMTEMKGKIVEGQRLFIIDGYVVDFESFINNHPGGDKLLINNIGRDVTAQFNGGLNNHTLSARLKMKTLRIGVLQ